MNEWVDPRTMSDITLNVSDSSDLFTRNMIAVRIEQRVDGQKVAAWMSVSADILDDTEAMGSLIRNELAKSLRKILYPWEFADTRRWPMDQFDPFPRWTALRRHMRTLADRIRDAVSRA